MVAEVSGHNARFITREMPLAQAYQFRTVWFEKHNIEWTRLTESDNLSTTMQ